MNCVEVERVLSGSPEGTHTADQQAHLDSCPACASLVADLELITAKAKLLIASDEPGPSVWNAIEAQLRREGLIRSAERVRVEVPFWQRWRTAWLIPAAAALALVVGLKLYQPPRVGDPNTVAKQTAPAVAPRPVANPVSKEDQQLLSTVASRPPAVRARYRAHLDAANSFIHDAEESARNDPDDIYMQQMLMNAYEQKQLLYDLAIDRSSAPDLGEQ